VARAAEGTARGYAILDRYPERGRHYYRQLLFAMSGSVPLVAISSIVFIVSAALITWLFLTHTRA